MTEAGKVSKPRFGDIIENGWASEENPTRVGYFVREGRRTGRLNTGRYFEVTDGRGKFWELSPVGEHRITVRPGLVAARHLNAWHEDDGPALWWTRPVSEPPWVGTPNDDTWPGYHRWWTPLPAWPTVFTPTQRPGA